MHLHFRYDGSLYDFGLAAARCDSAVVRVRAIGVSWRGFESTHVFVHEVVPLDVARVVVDFWRRDLPGARGTVTAEPAAEIGCVLALDVLDRDWAEVGPLWRDLVAGVREQGGALDDDPQTKAERIECARALRWVEHWTLERIADRFGVSRGTVRNWTRRE